MRIYVLAGGPGVGKTAVINELRKRNYRVLMEAAREVGDEDANFKGKSINEIDKGKFQRAIFELQKKQLSEIPGNEMIFSDRGLGDTLAYYVANRMKIPEDELKYAKKFRYSKVFILGLSEIYEKDKLIREDRLEQRKIYENISKMYKKLGYKPIYVPFMPKEERIDLILRNIG